MSVTAFSQKPGLQLYIISQEDSSLINAPNMFLYESYSIDNRSGRLDKIVSKADSMPKILYVDKPGKYLFCFEQNIEGCYEKFHNEDCFEYTLETEKVIRDTLWAPLISRVILIPSAKIRFLYYDSGRLCDGYIMTFFRNSTGKLAYEGLFKRGIPRGVHVEYNEDGTICSVIEYSKRGKVKMRRFSYD